MEQRRSGGDGEDHGCLDWGGVHFVVEINVWSEDSFESMFACGVEVITPRGLHFLGTRHGTVGKGERGWETGVDREC